MSLHKPCAAPSLVTNLTYVQRKDRKKIVIPLLHLGKPIHRNGSAGSQEFLSRKHLQVGRVCVTTVTVSFQNGNSSKFQLASTQAYRFKLSHLSSVMFTNSSLLASPLLVIMKHHIFPSKGNQYISALSHFFKTSIFYLTPLLTLSTSHRPLRSYPQS